MFWFAFYRPFQYKMVTHARVFSLKPKFKISDRQGLFLCNSFHFLSTKFGYENMCSRVKINEDKIPLPIKQKKEHLTIEDIDFDFIEDFMRELESERLRELEAYLIATGLKGYTLTDEEQYTLTDFTSTGGGRKEFNLIDLFNIKNTGNILSRDIIENSWNTPYLCASSENNAVSSYISYDEKFLDKWNCIFIGGKTFVVSYQEQDFYSNDSHNLVLYLKNNTKRGKLTQLYLATCVQKSLGHQYSWWNSVSNKKIQSDKIKLPINKNNQPDYEKMEVFISAIQKLVIKDVVNYTDRKINATKEVIARE